jgi:hypothetical protein
MGGEMVKVEAVVVRERVETVIDAVEQITGHVGVTVIEAGRPRPPARITDEYKGRVFESRFRLGNAMAAWSDRFRSTMRLARRPGR